MAFRIQPDQPLASEVRRLADKQLQLAIAGLQRAVGEDGDRRIHTARRHVKKVRAIIELVAPRTIGDRPQRLWRLRHASRRLGAVADSEALARTLAELLRRYPHALPLPTTLELRASLQANEAAIRRRADFDRLRRGVAAQLARERLEVHGWTLDAEGVDAVTRGLRRSARRARRAMRRALAAPSRRRDGAWRRRVKTLWFQMRLLEACTDGQLTEDQQRLEQLDGVLGEVLNCALLCDALVAGALRSRDETVCCLRVVRRFRAELRREARCLAPLVHGATPSEFVDRVEHAWCASEAAGADPPTVVRRPPAA